MVLTADNVGVNLLVVQSGEHKAHTGFLEARYCCESSQQVNKSLNLVPSLIEGLRVVQGLRVVPVFLYRYSTQN
jgi:hypothetical protein